MLPTWCTDTLTVIRPEQIESRGTTVDDWSRAKTHFVHGCSVQPTATSADYSEPNHTLTAHVTVFAPPDADIQAGDRVEFDGQIYKVDGAPVRIKSPFGRASHTQIQLIYWE